MFRLLVSKPCLSQAARVRHAAPGPTTPNLIPDLFSKSCEREFQYLNINACGENNHMFDNDKAATTPYIPIVHSRKNFKLNLITLD